LPAVMRTCVTKELVECVVGKRHDGQLAEEKNRIAVAPHGKAGLMLVGRKRAQAGCVTQAGDSFHNNKATSH